MGSQRSLGSAAEFLELPQLLLGSGQPKGTPRVHPSALYPFVYRGGWVSSGGATHRLVAAVSLCFFELNSLTHKVRVLKLASGGDLGQCK